MLGFFFFPEVATEGVHVNNAPRDLGKKWLQPSKDLPQPYMVELPFDNGLQEITFFLPHELVQLQVKEKVPWKLEPGTHLHAWIGKALAEQNESIEETVPLPSVWEQQLHPHPPEVWIGCIVWSLALVKTWWALSSGSCSTKLDQRSQVQILHLDWRGLVTL